MHRYIAFAWNHQIAEKDSLAKKLVRRLKSTLPEWRCALATEGLHLYHVGERSRSSHAYLLDQDAGVVLGKVFVRHMNADLDGVDYDQREVAFNRHETQKIRETEGRHLIEHYWGRYVALLRVKGAAHIRILRDPTGAMPCLLTKFRGIDVICSDIDDCATLGLINCEINWDHIAAYFWSHHLNGKETGLRSVRQLRAGECIAVSTNSRTATFYWSPARIHDARTVEDRQHAMVELRKVIKHCVGAWASCYNRILHGLSGGLDSSVVLACLSKLPGETNVVCQNHFTHNANGDERVYARKAASHAKVELIETVLGSSVQTLETMFEPTRLATPTMTLLLSETELLRRKLVEERGFQAMFTGQGGDHLFQQLNTPLIAADYAWHHGLRRELLKVIADTSRFSKTSIWSVTATAITSGLLRRREDPYARRMRPPLLVSESTRDVLKFVNVRHPYVDDTVSLPNGKLRQIVSITDIQKTYRGASHYAEIVNPLISQPIIELCLQIPSYVLTYGGKDRALVRDAFSEMVPPEIIKRTTKSAVTSFYNDLFVRDLPFLREFLLDGCLMAEGMLDRVQTEAKLTESTLISDPQLLWPTLNAIRAEAWLRTWIGEDRRAVA